MKKILTSKWFAAVLGMAAFLVTIILFWNPVPVSSTSGANAAVNTNTPAATPADTNHSTVAEVLLPKQIVTPIPVSTTASSQVGEPGSLRFDNAEVVQLRTELQQEKTLLQERQRQLNELAARLKLEMEVIGSITQEMLLAKAALQQAMTNNVNILQSSETNQLRQLASIYTNMAPDNAVAILQTMTPDEIARILHLMETQNKAAILENFVTNKLTTNSGKATEISERLLKLAPKPQLPSRRSAPSP
jgi:flagellar motility protein MotE (MotC chaperone)